ncbi:hypothetical protein T11_11965 [Trichinella zimbabwensis]|uniref:Uncharacterized protein n=1 Tax=Trichinella zimbabwensis TaxID=268475 RepID=A0A0V1GCX2_9BILA|nr:hypothetical protein T11_11965 [Trichinella zimbabwensis]
MIHSEIKILSLDNTYTVLNQRCCCTSLYKGLLCIYCCTKKTTNSVEEIPN